MKAILVIDMPISCIECPFFQAGFDGYCPVGGGDSIPFRKYKFRSDDCPLKPLPPHEKALMFGSEFEMFSEKVGEIVLDAIEETDIDKGEEKNV